MNGALLAALERIEREKGIDKEVLFEAIESALVSAARKVIDDPEISKEDITVEMDKETGDIRVFSEGEEVENERFGRIAAQTAKQVIIQKIREAERDVVYEKYIKKVGMIISGAVHRFEKGTVIIELDDTEAILPKAGQIPRERFRQGEQMRAYLQKVERGTSGPEIVLSRTDEGFVRKLFELEVPEISQGIVEIKAIAREAGERTKIAVHSKDEKVDPVGACVGMRGSRVRDIVKELHGERIDIVRWYDDIRDYIPAAVSPAEVTRMVIDREKEKITLTVPKDQLALLIGKKGRNIRLASKLLGWELVAESAREILGIPVSEIKGLTKKSRETLKEFGYGDIDSVIEAGVEGIVSLKGIGPKTAEKIISLCEEVYKEAVKKKEEEVQREEAKKEEEGKKEEISAKAEDIFSKMKEEEEEPASDEPQEEVEEDKTDKDNEAEETEKQE